MSDNQLHNDDLCATDGCAAPDKPVELVVFDFDKTIISGESPAILVRYLNKNNMLKFWALTRIVLWGVAYTLRLPQNEAWVRNVVFSAFEDVPKQDADEFMFRFYDDIIARLIRPQAIDCIKWHLRHGREVLLISATFEPIAIRAAKDVPYSDEISTVMKTSEDNCYLPQVNGVPIEGEEKVRVLTEFANEKYGKDKWELAYAYADHHSDRFILQAAKKQFVISPRADMRRYAMRQGWPILDWGPQVHLSKCPLD